MKKFHWSLAAVGILVVVFGTIYAAVQQAQRSAANYPQIQLAEDAAARLDQGELPTTQVTGDVSLNKSLAPFVIVYDKKGQVVVSSGYLDGKAPDAPIGILRAAAGKDYHAVTWQPKKGVRIAAVSVAAKDYYVLSGRSLREVEKNETQTMLIAILGAVIALLLLGIASVTRLVSHEYA